MLKLSLNYYFILFDAARQTKSIIHYFVNSFFKVKELKKLLKKFK